MLQFEYYHENPIFIKRQKGQKDKKSIPNSCCATITRRVWVPHRATLYYNNLVNRDSNI